MDGSALDQRPVDAIIIRNILAHDLEQVIDLATHSVEFDDLWDRRHGPGEIGEPCFVMLIGLDCGEYRHAEIQPLAIKDCNPFDDIAFGFEPFDPLPARTGRQTDRAGNVAERSRRIGLKGSQYLSVDKIKQIYVLIRIDVKNYPPSYRIWGIIGKTFSGREARSSAKENDMIQRLFVAHPASVGESYGEHFRHALTFSGAMFLGAFACLVHAVIPSMFARTGSGIIARLHDRMVVNRITPRQS